jgi:acetyl-CoA carboxylase biotin carboxyl carrier protein
MNIEEIERVAAVLKASPHLTELEVREGNLSLRLRRAGGKVVSSTARSTSRPVATATLTSSAPSALGVTPVKAQVVGIFHTNITVGETVKAGQVLGQIEAMRLMNDCVSPITGVLESVAASDQKPVEYGQLLFTLLPILVPTPEETDSE